MPLPTSQPDKAIAGCEEALRLLSEIGDRVGEAETWDSLGCAQQLAGRYDNVVTSYHRSIELCRELGDRYHVAEVLTRLGDAHEAAHCPAAARAALRQALDILEELRHPSAAPLGKRLREADTARPEQHAEPAPPRRQ